MVGEGSPSISTAKKRPARGRRAFLQRKNGRRGVAEHFHSEKTVREGSRSISTAKKWPARGRGAFLQRKNGRRGVAEHSYSEKIGFRSLNHPFRVCFFYITKDGNTELMVILNLFQDLSAEKDKKRLAVRC